MWYAPVTTVAAASEPVDLATAKAHLRVDADDENAGISALIAAARDYVELYCGIAIVQRTVTIKCDGFADFAALPLVPLISVSSVSYVDGTGATQTLAGSVYEARADGMDASIVLKNGQSWPDVQDGSRITVTAVVGFATIPDAIKHAILLLVGEWYDARASDAQMPMAVTALLTNYRSFL